MSTVTPTQKNNWVNSAAIFAILFGVLTVISGGTALFGSAQAKAMAGNVVGFVLWFYFLAGFVYVLAGAGLYTLKKLAVKLTLFIAVANMIVLLVFVWHVASGYAYEMRTIVAMLFRCIVWVVIATVCCRAIGCRPVKNR
jgi:hypothetical protein